MAIMCVSSPFGLCREDSQARDLPAFGPHALRSVGVETPESDTDPSEVNLSVIDEASESLVGAWSPGTALDGPPQKPGVLPEIFHGFKDELEIIPKACINRQGGILYDVMVAGGARIHRNHHDASAVLATVRRGERLVTYEWDTTRRWRKLHWPYDGHKIVGGWVMVKHELRGVLLREIAGMPASIGIVQDGDIPQSELSEAIRHGDGDLAQGLIDAGEDLNARDEFGESPLFTAATMGDVTITAALLCANADPGLLSNSGISAVDVAGATPCGALMAALAPADRGLVANVDMFEQAMAELPLELQETIQTIMDSDERACDI